MNMQHKHWLDMTPAEKTEILRAPNAQSDASSRAQNALLSVCDFITTGEPAYIREADRTIKVYSSIEDVPLFTPAIVLDRKDDACLTCLWATSDATNNEVWSVNVIRSNRGEVNFDGIDFFYGVEDQALIRDYISRRHQEYKDSAADF